MKYPQWKVLVWAGDDEAGTSYEIKAHGGRLGVDLSEMIREFSFKMYRNFNTPPDDWDTNELIQRGSFISLLLTDDGSFLQRFSFTATGVTTAPAAGNTYTNNGSTFAYIESTTWPSGAVTYKFVRTVGTADPELAGDLTRTSGAGDATITFTKWAPHTREMFYGTIHEVDPAVTPDGPTELTVTCRDKLDRLRTNGVTLSLSAKVLLYEATWAYNGAEWNSDDPDFLVDVPDDGSAAYDEEFMSDGIVSLTAYRVDTDDDSNDINLKQYDSSEYEYSAAKKQIYFRQSQTYYKTPGATPPDTIDGTYEWKVRLYYYDPTDDSTSIKNILLALLTGTPWSDDGGCGIALADIDLAEIMSFDGSGITRDQWGYSYTTGTPRRMRNINTEKVEGPIMSVIDKMRDEGFLPRDYWIRFDPQARKVIGRYMLQDSTAALTPEYGVEASDQPVTMESIAGRVECWSPLGALQDFAKNADIAIVDQYVDNPGRSFDNQQYDEVGVPANLIDGLPNTVFGWEAAVKTADFVPQKSTEDAIVLHLADEDGNHGPQNIRRIQLTGNRPISANDTENRIYIMHRLPRVTISASMDAIVDGTNPGVPVAKEAINAEYDPQNPGANNGLDIDVECKNITRAEYVVIRWDQDCFYKSSNVNTSKPQRCSDYQLSCVKVLGDGRIRYREGTDKGKIPYAQITDKGGTITNIAGLKVRIPVAQAVKFEVADVIVLWDTSGAVPFAGTNIVAGVDSGTGDITLTSALPVGLVVGDKIGIHYRWRLGLASATDWRDFYYPLLYQKIHNCTDWLEIVEDETPSDASECEGLAVERLSTLIQIMRDEGVAMVLDLEYTPGCTILREATLEDWQVSRIDYSLDVPDPTGIEDKPLVSMAIGGTNYEGTPQ